MTDDFLSRAYADNHQRLSNDLVAGVRTAIATLHASFARLHAHQFDAPWRHDPAAR